ncbi:MAG: hypothetical protein HUU03_06515 [Planctomycetaceae bacterium]|nr:hypothetical protein [Planctomycetota bacterium]MCQ3948749.1 hypothetical protein [Planctomycetota bacterium]NUO16079.1 hypothetical protein [Planctomycetaceae bacterium]GIK52768.1 MAG: hypothetical protein BroJett014_17410 [Planctomycetota bacterium]HRJ79002.1 SemiSWEET family transporter [Planctomycetota bacterium]
MTSPAQAAPHDEAEAGSFERPALFSRWFSRFMFIPGVGGNFVPLIQAIEIAQLRSSGSVSLAGFSFALFCILCWLIYGVLRRDKVLIWANVIGTVNLVILIGCIIYYR